MRNTNRGGYCCEKVKTYYFIDCNYFYIMECFSQTNPLLKGFYQSEMIGSHIVQMLVREEDNSFVEWINNREVDRGTYEKLDDKSYRIKGNRQNFEITLNDDNSFEIVISKLNDGTPIIMKNIRTDDFRQSFVNLRT